MYLAVRWDSYYHSFSPHIASHASTSVLAAHTQCTSAQACKCTLLYRNRYYPYHWTALLSFLTLHTHHIYNAILLTRIRASVSTTHTPLCRPASRAEPLVCHNNRHCHHCCCHCPPEGCTYHYCHYRPHHDRYECGACQPRTSRTEEARSRWRSVG